jgi:hypothetical protein
MIDKQEFLKRLKEDKFHQDIQEHINYRLPVIQFYLKYFTNLLKPINSTTILHSNQINIVYCPDTDFLLVNQAFDSIKQQFKKAKML